MSDPETELKEKETESEQLRLQRADIRAQKYKILSLTFGVRNDILDQCGYIDLATGVSRPETGKLRFLHIKAGVRHENNRELTDKEIRDMDEPLASFLYRAVLKKSRVPLGI